jgi:hypothetical protein
MTPAESAMFVILATGSLLLLLVLLAAPMEFAARKSRRFSDFLDRVIERIAR